MFSLLRGPLTTSTSSLQDLGSLNNQTPPHSMFNPAVTIGQMCCCPPATPSYFIRLSESPQLLFPPICKQLARLSHMDATRSVSLMSLQHWAWSKISCTSLGLSTTRLRKALLSAGLQRPSPNNDNSPICVVPLESIRPLRVITHRRVISG